MSNLDARLSDILYPLYRRHIRVRTAIPQIIQAFTDEGYVKNEFTDDVMNKLLEPLDSPPTFTGQEWYDRFVKEVDIVTEGLSGMVSFVKEHDLDKSALAAIVGDSLDKAAKKAAGLE